LDSSSIIDIPYAFFIAVVKPLGGEVKGADEGSGFGYLLLKG
jgi:hypothetical protein